MNNGDKIGTVVLSTHQEVQMMSCTVCRKAKGRAKVEVSTASATTVENQVVRSSSVMQKVEKAKGKVKKGDSKGWSDSKGWTTGKGWSEGEGWNTSGEGWEQQRPAGMNNLERDSKQYESTQEKTVRDSDWCVPVKHVAKLSRMRGSTSTKTNIKFFVDPGEEDRYNDTTPDCLGSKQFSLEDNVNYKCSCCEANGMQWKRAQNLPIKKPSVRFSSLTDADINFFEKGNTDLCELQQNTCAPVPKSLVVDSRAGETVMPLGWLTNHLLTESDGSRANDFYATADGSKVYNEGQIKLDVCTLDGQQRRSMTFQVARVKKALGSSSRIADEQDKERKKDNDT